MTTQNTLSLSEFKQLTSTLIESDVFIPTDEQAELVAKARSLGYVKEHEYEYTDAGLEALSFRVNNSYPSAVLVTKEGRTLTRNEDTYPCWLYEDVVFDIDEETGLPMDMDDDPMEGLLTIKAPLTLEVDGQCLEMQVVINKDVDWNEAHHPEWELVIDKTTEAKLTQYTNKTSLNETISCFSAPQNGLTGEIELTNDNYEPYNAQYTIVMPDNALNEILDIADDRSHQLTM